jgi:anti-sigma factor RsiW
MNDPIDQRFRESLWRRPLTAAEEAELRVWLAAHPEAQGDWETELGLNEMLNRLPDAPVPGNFTARVMDAVELEAAAERRQKRPWYWSLRSLLPRAAFAALAVGFGLFTYRTHQATERAALAQQVAAMSGVAASDPELFRDFEPIRRLGQARSVGPDEKLLALLQSIQ